MSDVPPFRLDRFHRTDTAGELGYGDVVIAGHVTVRFRLVSYGQDVYLVGPTVKGQTGMQEVAKPSRKLREALLPLFTAEYEARGREQACRRCGVTVRWERGTCLDAATLEPHDCRAAA